jgi:undecaprenyl-diphosphatase
MRIAQRAMRASRAVYEALGLSLASGMVLSAGLVALAGSLVAFGGAVEDVTQHNGVAVSDPAHLRFFINHRSHALDQAARMATTTGMIAVLFVIAIAASALFWYRGLRVGLAIAPVVSLAGAAFACAVTKSLVGRTRPPVSLHLVTENDASFPSGHATNSAAVFFAIAFVAALYLLRRPIARAATILAAALLSGSVGISRLVLGVHWPSDVLAGWALGLAVALAVTMTLALVDRVVPRHPQHSEGFFGRTARRTAEVLTMQREQRSRTLEAA